ncbi:MAG: hypothetical protein KJ666_00890 [Bacteroidetes bacterium]|nr:hypothetical protein [Bacteroidota bacterium]
MKIHIIFFPILLLFIFIGESFSQKEEKIFVEADSLTKEKIENYLEQNKKRNQKIQYEILRVKPPENIDYKILYAYIDTTVDYKILVYNPEKKLTYKELTKYFRKVIPDSLLKPKK